MKKLIFLLFTLWQLVLGPALVHADAKIPDKPTSSIYVQDYAKVLSANTKATINAYSEALAAKTKAQIVVVTMSTLEGADLSGYSTELFRSWGIGDKEKNNGVLLLVAVNDRKSRIEVGYGLEGALPDGLTGRIQDTYMLPSFRQNNYDKGILNGYSALLSTVLKEYKINPQDLKVQGGIPQNDPQEQQGLGFFGKILLLGIIVVVLILDQIFFRGAILRFIFYMLLFSRRGGGGGFGGGSSGGGGSNRSW